MLILLSEARELKLEVSDALRQATYFWDERHGGKVHPVDETQHYDAVILPLDLTAVRGIEALERCRKSGQMPVVIFTPQAFVERESHKNDDRAYGKKTHTTAIKEMLARIPAPGAQALGSGSTELSWGPLRIDAKSSKAHVAGRALKLTSFEFRLLCHLMRQKGGVVSRAELVELLYDQHSDANSNTIEVFIGRLRKKLAVDVIETVRGMGYRMRDPQERT